MPCRRLLVRRVPLRRRRRCRRRAPASHSRAVVFSPTSDAGGAAAITTALQVALDNEDAELEGAARARRRSIELDSVRREIELLRTSLGLS